MRKIMVSIVVCAVALALSFQSLGQAPQLSVTQNFLEKVDRKTCALRAQEILKQLNFSISKLEGEEMVIAGNQDVAIAVFCDWCGTVVNVNISVASSRTDRDVVKLRDQILAYIATPPPATGGVTTNTEKKLWLDKSTFSASEPVVVHFASLPGNTNDWITIVPVSQAINAPGPWKYTAGKKDGELKWEGGFP
ncbi:MAG: hypothetical protein KA138_15635, partial [Saprospiraceae bacterium]|nr:hypothetical protein [Saprospiraceae bacterium]